MDTKAIRKATNILNRAQKKLARVTDNRSAYVAKAVEKAETRFSARLTAATAGVTAAKTALTALVGGN